MDTRLWAVAETQAGGALATEGRWYRQFTGGKRVTGPISLFNGVAYFATFTPNPASAAQCNDGFGSIWGLDYLTGAGRLPSPGNPGVFVESEDQAPGTVVFGVAVTQTPSCFEESLQGSFFGAVRVLQGVTQPSYQLVYHTGAAGPADEQGAKANTSTLELPPPEGGVSVQSWASLVD
jgi:type IV pilus assembly protein PilY1